jgi:hypothetical protein
MIDLTKNGDNDGERTDVGKQAIVMPMMTTDGNSAQVPTLLPTNSKASTVLRLNK